VYGFIRHTVKAKKKKTLEEPDAGLTKKLLRNEILVISRVPQGTRGGGRKREMAEVVNQIARRAALKKELER